MLREAKGIALLARLEPFAGVLGAVAVIGVWQIGAMLSNPIILPSPWATLLALVRIAREGELLTAVGVTTLRTLIGFLTAGLLGAGVGIAGALHPFTLRFLSPVVSLIQGISPIGWMVLAIIWFKHESVPPVFLVFVGVLPVVFAAAVEGISTTSRNHVEMAKAFRVPRLQMLTDIYLPHLISYLFPAVTSALGMAWKVVVMAELMAADSGIGAALAIARTNLDVAGAIAWILVAVILMFGMEHLILAPLQRWLQPWRHTDSGKGRRPGSGARCLACAARGWQGC